MTDLYESEDGGYPTNLRLYARPVVGGHFSFMALENACGGRAVGALDFLNEDDHTDEFSKVNSATEL
jgi:hypothetical protein